MIHCYTKLFKICLCTRQHFLLRKHCKSRIRAYSFIATQLGKRSFGMKHWIIALKRKLMQHQHKLFTTLQLLSFHRQLHLNALLIPQHLNIVAHHSQALFRLVIQRIESCITLQLMRTQSIKIQIQICYAALLTRCCWCICTQNKRQSIHTQFLAQIILKRRSNRLQTKFFSCNQCFIARIQNQITFVFEKCALSFFIAVQCIKTRISTQNSLYT
mmetsp:Transcript_56936/g.94649  ORF Transcript_56936/g.94649 Transcript_56936/m.94649 type:complete len:215 (+) Transcript_56936:754-1398(+)